MITVWEACFDDLNPKWRVPSLKTYSVHGSAGRIFGAKSSRFLSVVLAFILYIELFCSLCTSVLSNTARIHPRGIDLPHVGKVLKPDGLALSSSCQWVFAPPSLLSSSLSHTYPSSRSLLMTHLPSHLGWFSPTILYHSLLWAQGKFCFHGSLLLGLPLSIAEPLSFLSSLTEVIWTSASRITLMQPAGSYITVLKFYFILLNLQIFTRSLPPPHTLFYHGPF